MLLCLQSANLIEADFLMRSDWLRSIVYRSTAPSKVVRTTNAEQNRYLVSAGLPVGRTSPMAYLLDALNCVLENS